MKNSPSILLAAIHPYPGPQAVPLANAFLKAYAADDNVKLVDFFCSDPTTECATKLAKERPQAVGFSMYSWNRLMCIAIAQELKSLLPGVRVFAGGPEATADPLNLLRTGAFDYLISGEGEGAFAELCQRLADQRPVGDIPGVAILEESKLRLAPQQPVDLERIPSPYLEGILNLRDFRGVLWQLARGCSFACDFCFDPRGSRKVRRFPMERVEAELRLFAKARVSQVFVLDSTFNQDIKRAKAILRLIRRIAPDIHFHFEVRSEFIDHELAELFAAITCSLQIGLQSCDPDVLKSVGRSFNRADFSAKVNLLNQTGAVFGFDLMYGLPGDTLQNFRRSVDFSLALYPNHLDIFPLAVLPGTSLASRATSLSLNHLADPPYTLLHSPTMTADDMASAAELAKGCDIFYTRGKAVAWFNGVCHGLRLKASALLERFAAWLRATGQTVGEAGGDEVIWQLQRAFLSDLCQRQHAEKLLPIILDLVDYHHHYAAALQVAPPKPVRPQELAKMRLLELPFRLAPSTRLATFNYEILEILEAGSPDVRAMARQLRPAGSWAIIYPATDGIRTESMDQVYYQLLQKLEGSVTAGQLIKKLPLKADEAIAFLEFALVEGIIIS